MHFLDLITPKTQRLVSGKFPFINIICNEDIVDVMFLSHKSLPGLLPSSLFWNFNIRIKPSANGIYNPYRDTWYYFDDKSFTSQKKLEILDSEDRAALLRLYERMLPVVTSYYP